MIDVSYYPGCSLEGTAKDYRESIETVCERVGIKLHELEDWNCCGATAAHSLSHRAAINLSARNLQLAEKAGMDLVIPCALCFNRMKAAEKALLGPYRREYAYSFEGNIKIWDLLDFFCQDRVKAEIARRFKRPLKGLRPVCYYGCMANRPPTITDSRNWENPTNMDELLSFLGAEVIDWPYKTDCCGASHVVARPDIVFNLVYKLFDMAERVGANCIVVSCQMCQANLDMYQEEISNKFNRDFYFPILYFTELVGMAIGEKQVKRWLNKHFVSARPLIEAAGLSL